MEEIYDHLLRDKNSDAIVKVDLDNNQSYMRQVGGEQMENEIEAAVTNISSFGSNKHYFNISHHQAIQEELLLSIVRNQQI